MEYVVSLGVKPDLVSAQGFGDSNPVASNDTAQGRAQAAPIQASASVHVVPVSAPGVRLRRFVPDSSLEEAGLHLARGAATPAHSLADMRRPQTLCSTRSISGSREKSSRVYGPLGGGSAPMVTAPFRALVLVLVMPVAPDFMILPALSLSPAPTPSGSAYPIPTIPPTVRLSERGRRDREEGYGWPSKIRSVWPPGHAFSVYSVLCDPCPADRPR